MNQYLYFDIDRNELLLAPRGGAISHVALKVRNEHPVRIQFMRGRLHAPPATAVIELGVKRTVGSAEFLAVAGEFVEDSGIWEGVLDLNTEEAIAALGMADSISAVMDVVVTLDGAGPVSCQTIGVTLERPVVTGEEGTPSAQPTPEEWMAEWAAANLGTAAEEDVGTTEGTIPVLGAGGKLPSSMLPALALTETLSVANAAARLALTAGQAQGKIVVEADTGRSYGLVAGGNPATSGDWIQVGDRDITSADITDATADDTPSVAALRGSDGSLKARGSRALALGGVALSMFDSDDDPDGEMILTGSANGGNYQAFIGVRTNSGGIEPLIYFFNSKGQTGFLANNLTNLTAFRTATWPNQSGTVAFSENTVNLTGAQTVAGAKTFSGQMELTGQAATNGTSAMTRALGDARYGVTITKALSAASTRESTTAYAHEAGLRIPLTVGTWVVEGRLLATVAGSITAGVKMRVAFSGTATELGTFAAAASNNTGSALSVATETYRPSHSAASAFPVDLIDTTNRNVVANFRMTVVVSVAGNLDVEWAQNTSESGAGATSLRVGSVVEATLVP
jgi:hypothetical protein